MHCKNCSKELIRNRHNKQTVFCSKKCSAVYRVSVYVKEWLEGKVCGYIEDNYRLSACVRNFLLKESNHKCVLCGWGEKNPVSEMVPLHIDHIDGNASNCKRENLRVICPNCHSLTPNYGALNIGKSVRKYRSGGLV